jgi:hypothetical protein
VSARGENRPEARRKPVRERRNEPGRLVILDDACNRSSVLMLSGVRRTAPWPVSQSLPITFRPAGCLAFRPGFVLVSFGCPNCGVRW